MLAINVSVANLMVFTTRRCARAVLAVVMESRLEKVCFKVPLERVMYII